MEQINPKNTIRPAYFRMLLLSAAVMILAGCLTIVSEPDSIKASADQGDASALYNLGIMYATGEGVPQNDAEAVRWYQMAAEQGDADAQLNLGVMYDTGKGVPKDYVQAYAWSDIAAAQGHETAKKNLEIIIKEMSTADIAKAQELSREFWEAYGPNRALSK